MDYWQTFWTSLPAVIVAVTGLVVALRKLKAIHVDLNSKLAALIKAERLAGELVGKEKAEAAALLAIALIKKDAAEAATVLVSIAAKTPSS